MRFHQIRELLVWARDVHRDLSQRYLVQAASSDSDRVRMALTYVAEHEKRLQAGLEHYLSRCSEHRGVLDTWYDDPADRPDAPSLPKPFATKTCDSVQAVLDQALVAHRVLMDLYAHRAEHAVSEAEGSLFRSLHAELAGEVRRLSRDMQRLEDY